MWNTVLGCGCRCDRRYKTNKTRQTCPSVPTQFTDPKAKSVIDLVPMWRRLHSWTSFCRSSVDWHSNLGGDYQMGWRLYLCRKWFLVMRKVLLRCLATAAIVVCIEHHCVFRLVTSRFWIAAISTVYQSHESGSGSHSTIYQHSQTFHCRAS